MTDNDWERLCQGLEVLAQHAAAQGIPLVYHHHMGTVVQNRREIDRLLQGTQAVQLLADTGHLAFAGVDTAAIFDDYAERIAHVHLKDIRQEVVQQVRQTQASFAFARKAKMAATGWLLTSVKLRTPRRLPGEV